MRFKTAGAGLQILDTYGMTYALTAMLLIPGLFIIERLSIVVFTPAYLTILTVPFLLGPALVFAMNSRDGLRATLLRSLVLSPLVGLTGLTIVVVAMIVILIPLSYFVIPENFGALTFVFSAAVVVLASPMLVSLVSRVREGLSVGGLFQMAVLVAVMAGIVWIVVMTFDSSDTLGTFLSKDVVEHFIGAFTWYLPALSLASGVWSWLGVL